MLNFKYVKCQMDGKCLFFMFCFYRKQARRTKTFTELLKPNETPQNEQKLQKVSGDCCCL